MVKTKLFDKAGLLQELNYHLSVLVPREVKGLNHDGFRHFDDEYISGYLIYHHSFEPLRITPHEPTVEQFLWEKCSDEVFERESVVMTISQSGDPRLWSMRVDGDPVKRPMGEFTESEQLELSATAKLGQAHRAVAKVERELAKVVGCIEAQEQHLAAYHAELSRLVRELVTDERARRGINYEPLQIAAE